MKKVAVVGTGVAGMAAGYFLRKRFDVSFYEKQARPGGHTNTVTVDEDGASIPIDTGFIVFNYETYPNLKRFFEELEIPISPTSMSFSVQQKVLGLEYCGTGVKGLFAQKKNIFNPRFWKLLFEINRFNKEALEVLDNPAFENLSLLDYADKKKFSRDLLDLYLIPMSSAVWSTPPDTMLGFSAAALVRFFKNHGLLGGISGHLQWYTVKGGSRVYRDKVLGLFPGKVFTGNGVTEVRRQRESVLVTDSRGKQESYDHVILAGHADETLALLKDASAVEADLLSQFKYQKNRAVLHTDSSIMPKEKIAWSSWNYLIQKNNSNRLAASTIYWMNGLQNVSQKKDYFVSINDPGNIAEDKILWEADYEHPVFDVESQVAQRDLYRLNHKKQVLFCGSYFKYGFHEDAFVSGLQAARALGGGEGWA